MKLPSKKKQYSDEELYALLKASDRKAVKWYFLEVFNGAKKTIANKGGTLKDLPDYTQDAVQELLDRINEGRFQQFGSLVGFGVKVCLNKWKKSLRHLDRAVELNESIFGIKVDSDLSNFREDLLTLVISKLKLLKEDCKLIINLRYSDPPMDHKEISEVFNINDESSRKKLSRCIARLRKLVFDSNDYKKLNNGE